MFDLVYRVERKRGVIEYLPMKEIELEVAI